MRLMFAAILLATTGTHAQAASIFDTMGPIMAEAPDAAAIAAKCDSYVAEIERRQAVLESESGPATIGTTLTSYDELIGLIGGGAGEFGLYQQVMADQARRDAGAACQVRLTTLGSRINLSRPIFDRLSAIDAAGADAATSFYLTRTLGAFERAGVALGQPERSRVQQINEEMASISAEFADNIANSRTVVSVPPEELAGLPDDYIAAHAPGPDGLVAISTDYPDIVPAMTYADSDSLRRRLIEAFDRRAHPVNDPLLARLFALRQELATILGRPNYATLILEDKMVGSPAQVQSLIDDMAVAARPAAERDYAKALGILQERQPGASEITYWQTGWLSPQVQRRYFDYDRREARQYFAYNNVRDGILALTEDLFGVDIRPWQTPVWDADVETYEMVENGTVIGRFYFDSHPRPGKYSHANMIPLRPGVAGETPPVGALVMNFPKGDHSTGLMEHGDVETFLHEFGHMLHGMFGGSQRWFGQSGIATEWDFAEAPSQMLEEWVFDYDTLARFAVNAKGETIPRDLVERMNRARYFNRGMTDLRQLAYANVSLQFHQNPVPADLGAATRGWYDAYAAIPAPSFVEMQSGFGHLDSYSAIYYTYQWSRAIADDLFTRFAAEGLRNPRTAADYRRLVLEPGGTKPAAALVQDFLGRAPTLDAYRTELAKDL